jgi:hypothetical protein
MEMFILAPLSWQGRARALPMQSKRPCAARNRLAPGLCRSSQTASIASGASAIVTPYTFHLLSENNLNLIRAILCTTALLASAGFAHADPTATNDAKGNDGPERIAPRQQPAAGKNHVLSTNGWSEMTLNDNAVYLQMTDHGIKQLDKPREAHEKAEGFLDNVFAAMALSGVKQLFNHSIVLSLTDTRSALVRNGEVILVTCNGKEVFNSVKFNGEVQKYPQDGAEEFVRNVNRQRAKLPACRT